MIKDSLYYYYYCSNESAFHHYLSRPAPSSLCRANCEREKEKKGKLNERVREEGEPSVPLVHAEPPPRGEAERRVG